MSAFDDALTAVRSRGEVIDLSEELGREKEANTISIPKPPYSFTKARQAHAAPVDKETAKRRLTTFMLCCYAQGRLQ